jgi:hypothetical protein
MLTPVCKRQIPTVYICMSPRIALAGTVFQYGTSSWMRAGRELVQKEHASALRV